MGGAALEKSDFSNTLFLELRTIFLLGQLKISFAAVSTSYSATITFETVEDEVYREALDLILAGIDPAVAGIAGKDRSDVTTFEGWPMKIRNEAHRFSPGGQRVLAAVQWPAISDGSRPQLVSPGALLFAESELVVISEEKNASTESSSAEELKEKFGGTITFSPGVRLADFHFKPSGELRRSCSRGTRRPRRKKTGDHLSVRRGKDRPEGDGADDAFSGLDEPDDQEKLARAKLGP
jgi:hypothetical protein